MKCGRSTEPSFALVLLVYLLSTGQSESFGGLRQKVFGKQLQDGGSLHNTTEDYSGPTRMFVIETERDARKMAELHSTSNKEIMFTTYTFTHKQHYDYGAINLAKHIWESLGRIGRLENSLIITYDVHSCQVLWEHGIPCFLDRYLPQPNELPGQYGSDVPHWYQKYAWALKLISWGYVATFFEADMIFLKDPIKHYNPNLDLEGLSDWHLSEIPSPKDRFTSTCSVYHMEKNDNGDSYLQWGPHDPNNRQSVYSINPCMSTGFWFIQPTRPAMEFLESYMDLMLNWRNWQIDQLLWNEVIMSFLIGQKHHRPLQFSILDVEHFSNFEVYDWRKEQNKSVDPVMLHAGAMPGPTKEPYMRKNGFYFADEWNMTRAEGHIGMLKRHFQLTLPTFNRGHLGDRRQ